jgi:hypothetical protein
MVVGRHGVALYSLGLAFLCAHELDAVRHTEWRLLFVLRASCFVLRDLPDPRASAAFVGLHVPLFFVILWLSHHRNQQLHSRTRVTVAAFLVVHAGLHFALALAPVTRSTGALEYPDPGCSCLGVLLSRTSMVAARSVRPILVRISPQSEGMKMACTNNAAWGLAAPRLD